MKDNNIIIIGSGAAGISALEAFRQLNQSAPVVIISGEQMPNYSPCALPYVISEELPYKQVPRLDQYFLKRIKAKPIFGSRVCRINTQRRSVVLDNGKSFSYGKLLIASGSGPVVPPIPGIGTKGVFTVDTLKNTRKITGYLAKHKVKKAAVIGAGFTGIETALALNKQGIKTVIIELLDRILARILDADFASIAGQFIKAEGVEVKLNTKLVEIKGSEKVSGIIIRPAPLEASPLTGPAVQDDKPESSIDCQMVIIAIGVKPNTAFMENSGITIFDKGIVVDEHMRTNMPDVYAAGDVAESFDYLSGERTISAIWPNAIEQGRVAGQNMAGLASAYAGAQAINIINIHGQPIVSMGKIGAPEIIDYRNDASFRRLFVTGGKITGFESIGEYRNSGFIWSCLTKRTDITNIKSRLLRDNFIPLRG
ncbi:MAG: FAD-dependent oxidoreductase [Planctomycetota bacterium]